MDSLASMPMHSIAGRWHVGTSRVDTASSFPSIVRAARRGDHDAWDVLFDRFHRRVLRYAMARLGELEGSEDVMQEVFVAAVQALPRLRDHSEAGIESWLLRIAQFKVADRIRSQQRERRHADSGVESCDDPSELALTRMSMSSLRDALEHLSAEQREVILRRFVMDQSLEQVAAATRRPVGAVKAMQRRALASLARIWEASA